MSEIPSISVTPSRRSVAWVVTLASFGSFVEFFDQALSATIAVVCWPTVFFSNLAPELALALGFVAAGVSLISRLFGSLIFGHFGDRIGRRAVLVWTLVITGLSSFFIGVLPPVAQVGVIAPILLMILRVVFGLGLGGEWGGATTWVIECLPKSKLRGLLTGLTTFANTIGNTAGALAVSFFSLVFAREFITFYWRWLFIICAVLLVIGVVARYFSFESPLFQLAFQRKTLARFPLATLIRKHWKILVVTVGSAIWWSPITFLVTTAAVPYAMQVGKFSLSQYAFSASIGTAIAIPFTLLGGFTSDRIGRRKALFISPIIALVTSLIYFPLIATGDFNNLLIVNILLPGLGAWFGMAILPAYLSESFPTEVRYTGAGFAYQLTQFFGGGLAGIAITPYFLTTFGNAGYGLPYTAYMVLMDVICLVFLAFFAKETVRADLTTSGDVSTR